MSPELEMGAGMGAGTGMAFPIDPFPPSSGVPGAAYLYGLPQSASADAMRVDDLLDFSVQPGFFDSAPSAPNPHLQPYYPHPEPPAASDVSAFPFDLCIPGEEEAAELEWLSRFVEDSFSGGMAFPGHPGMGGAAAIAAAGGGAGIHYGLEANYQAAEAGAVPGRPRTKRSRPPGASPAVAAAWSALAPASPSSSSSSSSETRPRGARKDQKEAEAGGVRKCTHCASEKTPQWRTGPLGPKTLCNACGVRYKSGRLVPEYRPAASPTFVLTQHSNSHRKVMELRRQKEMLMRHQQAAAFATAPGASAMPTSASARPDLLLRDYEVC